MNEQSKKEEFMSNMKSQLVERLGEPHITEGGRSLWMVATENDVRASIALTDEGVLVTIVGDGPKDHQTVTFTPVFGNFNILFQVFTKVMAKPE